MQDPYNKPVQMRFLAFGGIDIIVNNAGISISKPIQDHSIEDWDKVYNILVKRSMAGIQTGYQHPP